ncbi:MAG TPA: FkbM family methyltransferase, partial [Jiangellaceae bacterium]
MTRDSDSTGKAARPFVADIEPFLYGRPITYVDVGAYVGGVFTELVESAVRVRTAHLIEPNPGSYQRLTAATQDISGVTTLVCHNVAISDAAGTVTMCDEDTMSHVVGDQDDRESERFFEIPAVTLDELARANGIERIDLLKIDVEGHELSVIGGAKGLLSDGLVDVIYVEAGMDQATTQQVYYRKIEDALQAHGYRLFKVYEQTHEWPTDNPLLRRVNLCFMSGEFAAGHPYRLSRELFRVRHEHEKLAVQISSLKEANSKLERQVAETTEQLAAATANVSVRKRLESRLASTTEERDRFIEYATQLEQRYRQVLRSSSWRVTGPMRVAVRAAKRLTGRPDAGKNRMPSRPVLGGVPATGPAADVESAARHVVALVRASDYTALYAELRSLESGLATEQGFLKHAFAVIAWARKTSTFAFGAQAADAVFDRFDDRRDELRSSLGDGSYQRLITDAAVAYTRIGRYADARELLDREIAAGLSALRSLRAEVCWIHDPEQAERDLAALHFTGDQRNALLRRHLLLNVLDRPGDVAGSDPEDGEFCLVDAIRAQTTGRHRDHRESVNRFFRAEDLSEPLVAGDEPFSFDDLRSDGPEVSTSDALVSVIMTAHNAAAMLRYAVRSILRQSHQNLELVIIDDASTDGTTELLSELVAADTRIKVIHSEHNVGTYAAKNRAMQAAAGEYITFHDADDWAHPQRIARHLDAMESNPELMATRSLWLRADQDGVIDFRRWHKRLAHPNPAS